MKIAQFHDNGLIRLGIIHKAKIIPIDFNGDMLDLIKAGIMPEKKGAPLPFHQVKFLPPVTRPSKIIAIGLNYKDHAKESKGGIPEVPLVFAKFQNSLIGHNDYITWDVNVTGKVDFEAELAVIIGKTVHNCPEDEAMAAVFGYTCSNDVSARDCQLRLDQQWARGKSFDTFCPLGPWIETELAKPNHCRIISRLNGKIMQDSNTSDLIFNTKELLSYCSKNFTLYPGTVIMTGTPNGVGFARKPAVFLKPGDIIEIEIEGIGKLINKVDS